MVALQLLLSLALSLHCSHGLMSSSSSSVPPSVGADLGAFSGPHYSTGIRGHLLRVWPLTTLADCALMCEDAAAVRRGGRYL